MSAYVKLGIATLLPVIVSLIFYLLDKKSAFGKMKYMHKQIIYGIVFGLLAILGTEWGISINEAQVNCRDGAVITAGLLFGGPAGIIAGLIGGIERWFAIYWGIGTFTRIACSVSTAAAGFCAAALRKFMFENKKPAWPLSLAIGVVIEVFHLTMVFVTNIREPYLAFQVVKSCSAPMLIANSLSVCLSTIIITIAAKEKMINRRNRDKINISQTIQRWLLLCVVIAFIVTSYFTYVLQLNVAYDQTDKLLSNTISDIQKDIKAASDNNIISIANKVKKEISFTSLDELAKKYDVAEINIVDKNGIITQSTNETFLGYDMKSGGQSVEFMCLISEKNEFVQDYGPIAYDETISRKYAGVKTGDGFIQVGYDAQQFQASINSDIIRAASNRTVGQNGFVVVIDNESEIVVPEQYKGTKVQSFNSDIIINKLKRQEFNIGGVPNYSMFDSAEGYYIVSLISKSEAMQHCEMVLFATMYIEILIFGIMFVLIYLLIKRVVVNKMHNINASLSEITGGNMKVVVNVRSNKEFASLSDDINTTVDTLKHYIDMAAARIDKELELAKNIQSSALPTIFPDRNDFDIYACMDTAKEVGGDFYDFYLNHKKKLNILIADVSGKGIPAAMFMMRAKSELKGLAETDIPINDVFTQANSKLCDGNDAGMFVTAWQAQINLETGMLTFANAGHNPPLIKHSDGKFEFLKSKAGLVLAGMDGINYKKQELMLSPGDIIYLYTDGITEATNKNNELYGDDRLIETLNSMEFESMKDICENVKKDVMKFVADAPQFDDMTMLAFRFNGAKPKPQIHFDEAKIEDIPAVTEFIEAELEKMNCSMKVITQINIVTDEIYSNIAKFAYDELGPVTVTVEQSDDPHSVILTFTDEGKPYNPLTKEDPDVTLSAEEREIGGLGIYMVKKIMDDVKYEYVNEKNILILEKRI